MPKKPKDPKPKGGGHGGHHPKPHTPPDPGPDPDTDPTPDPTSEDPTPTPTSQVQGPLNYLDLPTHVLGHSALDTPRRTPAETWAWWAELLGRATAICQRDHSEAEKQYKTLTTPPPVIP